MRLPGHKHPVVFDAGAEDGDKNNKLKFVLNEQTEHEYFILENMQSAYEEIPVFIAGKYYLNSKIIKVRFWLVK